MEGMGWKGRGGEAVSVYGSILFIPFFAFLVVKVGWWEGVFLVCMLCGFVLGFHARRDSDRQRYDVIRFLLLETRINIKRWEDLVLLVPSLSGVSLGTVCL